MRESILKKDASIVVDEGYCLLQFVGLADQGKDIVFRFIIKYSSLRDFGPLGYRSIFI
jgi:hypothetical protein